MSASSPPVSAPRSPASAPTLELDPETVTAVRAALNEHKALVFRGISLDDEGQQRFARYFGELTTAHPTVPAVDGAPNVLPVDSEDGRANHWHTDVTFVLNPPQASTLRSIVIPPYGGETLIANTGAAYQDLPAPLRAFADTLWAEHTNDYDYAVPPESLNDAERERRAVFISTTYKTVHPVVRVHPLTGERGLFIGGFAQRIVGLSQGESKDILRLLQAYVSPARERPQAGLGAGPARAVRQPDHPALRHRQLRRPAPAAQPRHRGRRHPGRHRRQAELFGHGRRLALHAGRRGPGRRMSTLPGLRRHRAACRGPDPAPRRPGSRSRTRRDRP